MNAEFPEKLQFLFEPHRYKIAYGGRGGMKSWGFARALLIQGAERPLRILCAREIQDSIEESVHHLLEEQMGLLGLGDHYEVEKRSIRGTRVKTEFIFSGLKHKIKSLKSLEGADIVWVEEAQNVSKGTWDILYPTIRKKGSEIWVSFNPDLETDDTYQRFVVKPPPGAVVRKISWRDNPWFSEEMENDRRHAEEADPQGYEHVWEGACISLVEGAIYANELRVADRENRITRVPYDRSRPVDCYWDLGYGDKCAVWFVQAFPFEHRLIDFIENERKPITWYLTEMQQRGYLYGKDYLPWDLGMHAKLMNGGKSIEQTMRELGRTVRISPKLLKTEQLDRARDIFNLCYFDRERCADGLQALRHYRYGLVEKHTLDPTHRAMTREPLHDWSSHASDAFAYFAINQTPRKKKENEQRGSPAPAGPRSWMV